MGQLQRGGHQKVGKHPSPNSSFLTSPILHDCRNKMKPAPAQQLWGSNNISVKRLHENAAAARIASLTVQLSTEFSVASDGKINVGSGIDETAAAGTPVLLNGQCLRLMGLPLRYGVDEVHSV